MAEIRNNTTLEFRIIARNMLFVALAIFLFLMKRHYAGPFRGLILSYAGNVTISFALYFVFLKFCMRSPRFGRYLAAVSVLVCVSSFELLDGFGFMSNTYDLFDLLANTIGVGLAFAVDKILSRK